MFNNSVKDCMSQKDMKYKTPGRPLDITLNHFTEGLVRWSAPSSGHVAFYDFYFTDVRHAS